MEIIKSYKNSFRMIEDFFQLKLTNQLFPTKNISKIFYKVINLYILKQINFILDFLMNSIVIHLVLNRFF